MREVNGELRGLLKKANRPSATRKNRVVFDETRNEFFEADYIILIREDCTYDEEEEESCTCGEHELVRLCCEEGCQCQFAATVNKDNRTRQGPKFAPSIEFVDEAALSPPDGYKDNSLKSTFSGSLRGHIFGAQHIQQLQVIQRLQQQRAAMLAARTNKSSSSTTTSTQAQTTPTPPPPPSVYLQQQAQSSTAQQNDKDNSGEDNSGVCTECAECAECAAKQIRNSDECISKKHEEISTALHVPAVTYYPLHASSPERRITEKEIIAGEERPKYVFQSQSKQSPVKHISREPAEDVTSVSRDLNSVASSNNNSTAGSFVSSKAGLVNSIENNKNELHSSITSKDNSPTHISGILKGGKLWKSDSASQSDEGNNATSEDEGGASVKRSVRFETEEILNKEQNPAGQGVDSSENQINELIPIKKHSTLFNNVSRPNSAVRQLFPSAVQQKSTLTSEALRAFDESKRAGILVPHLPGSCDFDGVKRNIDRNTLRRSLIKKKSAKPDMSLEERIKKLTCDIDEVNEELTAKYEDNGNYIEGQFNNSSEFKKLNTKGDDNTLNVENTHMKSSSPNSSLSSSSSGSLTYKKNPDSLACDQKQENILEMEENPIVVIPQECRCPAAPDLGMGIQVPVVHTQIHRTPPRQTDTKRQFLSTLAPLTACVAGNKDDFSSYYTLAAAHRSGSNNNSSGNNNNNNNLSQAHVAQMQLNILKDQPKIYQSCVDVRKVAPDVIAGTPGQDQQDELIAFAKQDANRTENIKKRYTSNDMPNVNSDDDDDEQNDYGFNKRPSVRGIKAKFGAINEITQQMQEQLAEQMCAAETEEQRTNNLITSEVTSSVKLMPQNISNCAENINQQQHLVQHQQQFQQLNQQQLQQHMSSHTPVQIQSNAAISQQQTEKRTWTFYSETGEQQHMPVEAKLHQSYMQNMPGGAMFRQTMIQDESLMYAAAQNCQSVTSVDHNSDPNTQRTQIQRFSHYVKSPTRRPESPPPLRNYHQTMVLIPYNAETYSHFAAGNLEPQITNIHHQNILEYQQVTQQTIRVPVGYALPGMQLHVIAGHGHPVLQHPNFLAHGYQCGIGNESDGINLNTERGVPEGASADSISDCSNSMPTMNSHDIGQAQNIQTINKAQHQQHQQQQHQQQQQQQQQQQIYMQQNQLQTQAYQHHDPADSTKGIPTNPQSAQGSVYYAMNV